MLRASHFPFLQKDGPDRAGVLMDVHVSTWATPRPHLRRGHIAALIATIVFRVQLAIAQRRERRIRGLIVQAEDLPEYIKRDIGLV